MYTSTLPACRVIGTAAWLATAAPLLAQQPAPPAPAAAAATPDYSAFRPDPKSVPYVLPADIVWTGRPGRLQQYKVLGDVSKPGPYILLMKWWPGQFSRPHFHEKTRYITVISGTWWVSSSTKFDADKAFPLPAGSVAVDEANTVHWDGAKDDPVMLQISGEGPARSVSVDENGKAIPRTPNAPPPPSAD